MRFRSTTVLLCLALAAEAHADEPVTPSAIFAMKADGSDVRRVADVEGYPYLGSPRWSHDGTRLAFDAASETIGRRLFLVDADGAGLRPLGVGQHADWSPDDKQLVFAVSEKGATTGGVWVQNVDGRGRVLLAEDGRSPRWSPRGDALALIGTESLEILDLIIGGTSKPQLPASVVPGFDWSRDRKRLAIVTRSNQAAGQHRASGTFGEPGDALWIVDIADGGKATKIFSGAVDGYVAYSPDGKRLAISLDQQIHLLNTDGSGKPQPIPGQEGDNRMPAWSSDGQWFAFASTRTTPTLAPVARKRRTLRLEEVRRHTPGTVVYGVALSPDGRKTYIGLRKGLQIWDMVRDETTTLEFLHGQAIALAPDGRTLASCGVMIKVELGDVEEGKWLRDLPCDGMCNSTKFSTDGRRLVASLQNGQAIVWDVPRGKRLSVFKQHTTPVTRVAFLPGGEEVASNGQDKMLRIWNAETGQQRLAIAHPDVVWGLAVSPDGRLIATGTGGVTVGNPISQRIERSKDNTVRLWDAASGELVREMQGHTNTVFTLDFSPDGQTLASGGWDGTVRLWDVASGEQLASEQRQGSAFVVAFTPDGSELLVAGGENRSADAPVQRFPDEQVRLYRIADAESPQ